MPLRQPLDQRTRLAYPGGGGSYALAISLTTLSYYLILFPPYSLFSLHFLLSLLRLFYPFGAHSTDTRVANIARGTPYLLRTDPDSASIAEQVCANVSRLSSRARQSSDLNDLQRYPRIFRYPPSPPVPPHWGRPTGPDIAGVANRQDSWRRRRRQVRGEIVLSAWQHMEFSGNIRKLFLEVFREAARCEYPLYIPPPYCWGIGSDAPCGGPASHWAP